MDLALIKTFVEVAATGSFVSAADRLFVTQSAVSLRVQRLEELLGRPLFARSKTGTELTAAGREFEGYALSLLRTWEQARQQIAVPEGYSRTVTIGAQVSLWHRLGFRWVDGMRVAFPDLGIRAQLGMPEALTRAMTEGVMQLALTYAPVQRMGLSVEKLLDEDLVMVAPWPDPHVDQLKGRYVFVDWGEAFLHFHNQHFPTLTNPGLTLAMGGLTAPYIISRDFAAYLPKRYARQYIEQGDLHLVAESPAFPYPAWAVWRDDLDEDLAEVARNTLLDIAETAQRDNVDTADIF